MECAALGFYNTCIYNLWWASKKLKMAQIVLDLENNHTGRKLPQLATNGKNLVARS